jgi:hypothetical protein
VLQLIDDCLIALVSGSIASLYLCSRSAFSPTGSQNFSSALSTLPTDVAANAASKKNRLNNLCDLVNVFC